MTLVALDLNASRVRAAQGLVPREGRPVPLDGAEAGFPLAVSVEGRSPQAGRAGLALCRSSPHLACTGFLPGLGDRREWAGPFCKVDAYRALLLVLDHVAARAGKHTAAAVAIPGYLAVEQRGLVEKAVEQSRFRLHGTVDAALAAALTAHAHQPWDGLALVLDVDEHALGWTAVMAQAGSARILHQEYLAPLGERAWKDRLLTTAANACIRRNRRDPRDSPEAEQGLYDQLDGLMKSVQEHRAGEITVRARAWSQSMILGAGDLTTACRPLLDRAVRAFHACQDVVAQYGPLRAVLVSAAAARLPGLITSLEGEVQLSPAAFSPESNDPGEDLVEQAPLHVGILPPDAVAQATHGLAHLFHQKALSPGHLDAAPLPEALSPATGVARLQFRGREYLIHSTAFTLGRDPRCDLVFDTGEYPSVSANHCKIVYERHAFTLHDQSRHGTMINDRPVIEQRELAAGDWIRLGPGGPLLRFLGHTIDARKLLPTA